MVVVGRGVVVGVVRVDVVVACVGPRMEALSPVVVSWVMRALSGRAMGPICSGWV